MQVNVADSSGKIIGTETGKISDEDNIIRLNLEKANPGIYIIHTYSAKGCCAVNKLIIQ